MEPKKILRIPKELLKTLQFLKGPGKKVFPRHAPGYAGHVKIGRTIGRQLWITPCHNLNVNNLSLLGSTLATHDRQLRATIF